MINIGFNRKAPLKVEMLKFCTKYLKFQDCLSCEQAQLHSVLLELQKKISKLETIIC